MSSETTADTVPYARFRETIEKLREAEARIANLEGEVKSAAALRPLEGVDLHRHHSPRLGQRHRG